MKRPVTDQDLINDPSLASIGVKIGDEYDFEDAPIEDNRVPKFDPFTGKPLDDVNEPAQQEDAEPESEDTKEDAPVQDHDESNPSSQPISYADILERGLSLNKIEAANLHPGISHIAQWGDIIIRQEFKPEN